MKFVYQKSITINSDISNVWDIVNTSQFEQDFLPEIRRSSADDSGPSEVVEGSMIQWMEQGNFAIELTRKDLNVTINSIKIEMEERGNGVNVRMTVNYEKGIEKHFVKAHMAVRSLFTNKLRVLQDDFLPAVPEFALS
ncbi:MAG: hypothetical protein KTR32_24730 [Granulosicoccus sp.]|nr:hypothetical protein [Granulosicoccus sp.]